MCVDDAGGAQLCAHRRAKVDVDLVLSAPYDDALRAARLRDSSSHVSSDLEAARADAGTDRREERAARQRVDRGLRHVRDDAAPARVNGGYVTGARIGEKERDAVGHTHSHNDGPGGDGAWCVRPGPAHDGVGLGICCTGCFDDSSSVNLFHLDDDPGREMGRRVCIGSAARRKRVDEPLFGEEL